MSHDLPHIIGLLDGIREELKSKSVDKEAIHNLLRSATSKLRLIQRALKEKQ